MGVGGTKFWGGIAEKTGGIGGRLGVMWKSSEMEDKNENKSRKNTGNIFKRQNTFRHLENLLNI